MSLADVGRLYSWNAFSARGESVTVEAEYVAHGAEYVDANLVADVARNGVLVPLLASGPWLWNGMHRYVAARLAGLTDVPVAAPV